MILTVKCSVHLVLSTFDISSTKQYIKFSKSVLLQKIHVAILLCVKVPQSSDSKGNKETMMNWIELEPLPLDEWITMKLSYPWRESISWVSFLKKNLLNGKNSQIYHKFKILAVVSWIVSRRNWEIRNFFFCNIPHSVLVTQCVPGSALWLVW